MQVLDTSPQDVFISVHMAGILVCEYTLGLCINTFTRAERETPWVETHVNSTKWLNETQSTWHMNAALRSILKTLLAKLLLFQSH